MMLQLHKEHTLHCASRERMEAKQRLKGRGRTGQEVVVG